MPAHSNLGEAMRAVDPARVFLTDMESSRLHYGDLCAISRQFATVFDALGIASDDPVVILLPQGPEAVVAILATMNAAVAAPVNPALGASEMLALVQRIRPQALIADEAVAASLPSAIRTRGIALLVVSRFPDMRLAAAELPSASAHRPDAMRPGATGLLLPTSGTCGEPKLVRLSQAQLVYSAAQIASVLQLTGSDRNLCVLPCFHIHGLSTVLATALTGGVVISGGTFCADDFEQAVVAQQVSWLSATPVYYHAILASRQRRGAMPLRHSLRFLRSASAPIPDALARALEQAFGVPLIQAYGMTEAGPHIACNGLAAENRRMGSVGRPTGTEVVIRCGEGLPAPQNAVGEIVIRGDSVIREYFQDGSAQDGSAQDGSAQDGSAQDGSADKAPFCEGWFHTGDTGFLDNDGFLYVTGRIREMINRGGEKLSPRQVESVLLAHPAVRDAVVFPAPHATLGEVPHAAIVLKEGFLYADSDIEASIQLQHILRRYCQSHLAHFKVPQAFHLVADIPTCASGKVRRHTLHALLDVDTRGGPGSAAARTAPHSLQGLVATVWADVLGPGNFKPDDNFFELGGDSLKATMAINALERELHASLPANGFFQYPTVAQQAGLLARLSGAAIAAPQLPAGSTGDNRIELVAPLSAGQRRLWFLDQAGSGSEYNMGSLLRLHGHVDAGVLNQAVHALRQRHAALRTTIGVLDGNPVQRIRPCSAIEPTESDLTVVDISGLPREQRAGRALILAGECRNLAFELDRGPLFRCQLIRLDNREHLLAIGIHHILCDGWSMEILQRELIALYTQLAAGSPPGRLPPTVQFHDYVARCLQRQQNAPWKRQQQIAWWRQQFDDIDPILHLPGSRGQPGRATRRASHLRFSVAPAVVRRLEENASRSGATLYMVLASALGILLHRYTRQERFCLGTVAANRHDADLEHVVGFLAQTLPVPVRVAGRETVGAVVARCIDTLLGVFAHADIEFEEIVQACSSGRIEGVSPLFQVMFAFHNLPRRVTGVTSAVGAVDPCGAAELVTEHVVLDADCAKFDLSLHMRPGNDGLAGVWQYRRDTLDAHTIAAMNKDFATILRVIVDAPALSVADIPFDDDSLAHRADEDSCPRADAGPSTVMQLLARQAGDRARRTALRTKNSHLTYGDLLDRVGRLANYLVDRGIGPGKTVAILLPRDTAMVIAPLAVMATGAAFVPLDGVCPVARLRDMIEVARSDLLIVNSATKAILSPGAGSASHLPRMLCLDESESAIANCSPSAYGQAPSFDDPAYIIFTSGSTGRPKGVVISHGNLAHYTRAMSRELNLAPTDRYLHTASSAFSAAIRQYVLPLASGAEVVIADRYQVENVEALLTLVHRARVTILDLVPTLWRGCDRWLGLAGQTRGESTCPQLRLMLSASEPLPDVLARAVCRHWPHARLVNMYGQTETSGIVTTYPSYVHAERASVVALGKPIAGHAVHLLDESARPVPAGAVGEICVSGPCVGRGYLTIDSPFPAPLSQPIYHNSGTLAVYRTGDLGRYREDGNLEFRGRLDAQVKYKGFRIEPNEIESVALTHPQLTEAAVLVADSASAQAGPELQLLYCADPGAGAESLRAQLRSHLAQHLPSYMVPSQLHQVKMMPRTLSGKLDRGALRMLLPGNSATSPRAIPPSVRPTGAAAEHRAITQRLQAIWRDVLLCEAVGPHDNFFDLGGSSLLSIEVVSAAWDAGIHLTLDQVFQFQTIAELASAVQCRAASAIGGPTRPLARYTTDSLRAFSREALEQAGLPPEGAAIVAEVQLESSLRGQATHNVGDIPRYARRLATGVLNANPGITVVETSAISAAVDGDNGPGQWVATIAMDKAIALARRSGAGIVSVRRSNHFGAAGHYAWRACHAGMIGMCFTNGPVVLAPTGGITPLFGNNPLAIGLPRAGGHPVVLDIAMAVATRGRIGLAVAEGQPLQPGWILDKLGLPTTRLEDLAAGLAAPVGGHKGYGLALAIEILAGALTGAGYCRDHAREASARQGGADIGHFFIAFDPGLFIGRDEFEARVADIVMQVKSSELATGSTEIVVPGEIEFRAREENLRLGIPLRASVVRRLTEFGTRHKLDARLRRASQRVMNAGGAAQAWVAAEQGQHQNGM